MKNNPNNKENFSNFSWEYLSKEIVHEVNNRVKNCLEKTGNQEIEQEMQKYLQKIEEKFKDNPQVLEDLRESMTFWFEYLPSEEAIYGNKKGKSREYSDKIEWIFLKLWKN